MAPSEPAGLTAAEIEFYRAQGYVVPAWGFSDAAVAEMHAAVDAILAANPDHRPEQLVCPHLPGGATKPIEGEQHTDFLRFGTDPGLRRVLRQVVGDNVLMWGINYSAAGATGWPPGTKMGTTGRSARWRRVSVDVIDPAGPDNAVCASSGVLLRPAAHASTTANIALTNRRSDAFRSGQRRRGQLAPGWWCLCT